MARSWLVCDVHYCTDWNSADACMGASGTAIRAPHCIGLGLKRFGPGRVTTGPTMMSVGIPVRVVRHLKASFLAMASTDNSSVLSTVASSLLGSTAVFRPLAQAWTSLLLGSCVQVYRHMDLAYRPKSWGHTNCVRVRARGYVASHATLRRRVVWKAEESARAGCDKNSDASYLPSHTRGTM